MQRRFAVDQEVGFALENISGLDSGMGVPPGRTAGADFGEAGDRQVALGKFDFLQWRAFDALCKRRARAQCDDAPKATWLGRNATAEERRQRVGQRVRAA
jgi:hypothetical protein